LVPPGDWVRKRKGRRPDGKTQDDRNDDNCKWGKQRRDEFTRRVESLEFTLQAFSQRGDVLAEHDRYAQPNPQQR